MYNTLSFLLFLFSNILCLQTSFQLLKQYDSTQIPLYSPFPISNLNLKQYDAYQLQMTITKNYNYIYLAGEDQTLIVVDISNKQQPFFVQQIQSEMGQGVYTSIGLFSLENYLYLTQSSNIIIFSLKNKEMPVKISNYQLKSKLSINSSSLNQQQSILFLGVKEYIYCVNIENIYMVDQICELFLKGIVIYKVKYFDLNNYLIVSGKTNILVCKFIDNKELVLLYSDKLSIKLIVSFKLLNQQVVILSSIGTIYTIDIEFLQKSNSDLTKKSPVVFLLQSQNIYTCTGFEGFQDNKYFGFSQKMIGINILNIEQGKESNIISIVPQDSKISSFILTPDYIYVTGMYYFQIFQRTQANFDNQIPNLFNGFQSILQPVSLNNNRVQNLKMTQNNKQIIAAWQVEGVIRFNIENKNQIQPHFDKNIFGSGTALSIHILNSQDVAVIGYINKPRIIFANITGETPEIISQSNYQNALVIPQDLKSSKNNRLLIVSNINLNILIIDISNLLQTKIISIWNNITGNDILNMLLSKDDNYLYISVDTFGLYILCVQDNQNPVITSTLLLRGGDGMNLSYDQTALFMCLGQNGLAFIDIIDPKKPFLIKQLFFTKNSPQRIKLIDEKYALISVYGSGSQLVLIDLKNLMDPQIVSYYGVPLENSWEHITTYDQENIYISNENGLRKLPLKSGIVFNVSVYESLIKQGIKYIKQLDKDETLYVGQEIIFQLLEILPQRVSKIQNCQLYKDFITQNLPPWITINIMTFQIKLFVSKESLGILKSCNFNTILLTFTQQLAYTDFIDQNLGISDQMAQEIFQNTLNIGYISQDLMIKADINPDQLLIYKDSATLVYNEKVIQKIREVFRAFKFTNTIRFQVKPSLEFDYNDQNGGCFKSINSNQKLLITLTIEDQLNKFMDFDAKGVLISFHNDYQVIKIEGIVSQVNLLLKKKIIIANFTETSQIKVHLNAKDDLNYDLNLDHNIKDFDFLAINHKIYNKIPLSIQFEKQYSRGYIKIDEQINFDFLPNTFIDPEENKITYTAWVQKDGEYFPFQNDFWLKFYPLDRKLIGVPLENQLGDVYYIQIQASDGYLICKDEFVISVYLISLSFVLSVIGKYVAPLVGLLGFFQYNNIVYNIMCKKKYRYSEETVYIDKIYHKQIALIDNSREIAVQFWEFYKKNKLFKELKRHLKSQKQTQVIDNLNQDNQRIQQDENLQLQQSIQQSIVHKNGVIQSVFSPKKINMQQSYDFQSGQNNTQKNNFNRESNNSSILSGFVLQRGERSKNARKSKFFIENIQNFENLNEEIIKLYKENNEQILNHYLKELENKQSRITQNIIALATQYYLENDQITKNIFAFLKKQGILQYNLKDWYKAYVKIKGKEFQSKYTPFPDIEIDLLTVQLQIHTYFKDLQHIKQENIAYNINLLQQAIISESLGLLSGDKSQNSTGESINCFSSNINAIKSFQKLHSRCMKIREILNLDYTEYGLKGNKITPSWMKLQLISGVIHIYGIPTYSDCGQILIQIYDTEGYILKDYILNIKLDENNEGSIIDVGEQKQKLFQKKIDFNQIQARIDKIEEDFKLNKELYQIQIQQQNIKYDLLQEEMQGNSQINQFEEIVDIDKSPNKRNLNKYTNSIILRQENLNKNTLKN